MANKLDRKRLPAGFSPSDFVYQGRPAKDQGDFGTDVGIADLKCVDQFGGNTNKFYHGGVVLGKGQWFVYFEWGRVFNGRSWNGSSFCGQDFQFTQCGSESEARKVFKSQMESKNTKRLVQKGNIWVGKSGKDGYIVMDLATREKGLPDALTIKVSEGVVPSKVVAAPKGKTSKVSNNFHPAEISLAKDLVGGTKDFVARATAASGGVKPTLASITKIRDILLPQAADEISSIVANVKPRTGESADAYERRVATACISNPNLKDLSNYVASLVPRPDPGRNADPTSRAMATILHPGNIIAFQNDLNTMESSLKNEDFSTETVIPDFDPDSRLNATVRWLDPKSDLGKFVEDSYRGMFDSNSHYHLRGKSLKIRNMFSVTRSDRDAHFFSNVEKVGSLRKGKVDTFPKAQPKNRTDSKELAKNYKNANVMLGIHGTRGVNVGPILGSNFRLPQSLPGALITGAAFGHGVYFSNSVSKSHGYCGDSGSYWTKGNNGNIHGRGFFMFLCDVIMGDAYRATSTGSWNKPPSGKDSIAAFPEYCRSLCHEEYIIFDPHYQRIRYLVEAEFV